MEQDPNSSPNFSLQPPPTTSRHRKPPINPVVLIIVIPIIALIFLFFFLPPFLSYTSHIRKSASVKYSWNFFNIFVVLFAILCGVLGRRNDDVTSSNENSFVSGSSSNNNNSSVDHYSSGEWIEFSERKVVSGGLQRSCSSYPDLRQESLWKDVEIRNPFYDDSSSVSRYYNNLSRRNATETEFFGDNFRRREPDLVHFSDVKEIVVDTFEVSQNYPVTPPPPSPPLSAKAKRHSFRSVARKIESDEFEKLKIYTPPSAPPSPSPPSKMEARVHKSRNKHMKLEREVSDASKELATAISSIYNQKKRKSNRKLGNTSSSSDSSPPSVHFGSPETEDLQQTVTRTPLQPPPPTPFQNLYKKGGKHKRIHSVSPTVPPPSPPPPPRSIFNNIFKSGNKSKRLQSPSTAPPLPPMPPSSIMNNFFNTGTKSKRFNSSPPSPPPLMTPPRYTKSESSNRHSANNGNPPLPTKTSYYECDEFLSSSSQSPLIPMPPPLPPFRMPAMKFELCGNFVRIQSTHSSLGSSPDPDDSDLTTTVIDDGDLIGPRSSSSPDPLFFASPDINAKADSFIARRKDEWRKENINLVKDKMG